jgi:phenylpropionate dioxygenase-like ring-hydroxylating dioxygenase large terminal subunit
VPYHHWTYDTCGKLMSVPRVEAYGKTFQLAQHGLIEVPRVSEFKGLLFANLDPNAPTFEDYLGPAIPYLAEVAEYDGEELVTIGSYRYSYAANWKLIMENTLDDYHAEYPARLRFRAARGIVRNGRHQRLSGKGRRALVGRPGDARRLRSVR